MKKYLLTALIVLCLASIVQAAPVGLTSEADATKAKIWADKNIGVSAGVIYDIVDERKIDIAGGKFEMDAIVARIGLTALERFNFYVDLGQAQNMDYRAEVNAANVQVRYKYDDEFLWGGGVNALICRWDNGLEIGAGLSYRQAEMCIDKVEIDGIEYKRRSLDTVREGDYQEWQGAMEVAWRLANGAFIPYAGVKCSDVEVDGDVTESTVQYNASGKNAAGVVGVFAGLTLIPKIPGWENSEQLMINIECRALDEQAFNVGLSYKF